MIKTKTLFLCILFFESVFSAPLTFRYGVIDNARPSQRVAADIDGDGFNDLFASVDLESGEAASAYGIYWYAYPDWQRYTIASNVNFRADDLEYGDIDGDGDADAVITVDEDGKVYWYENPLLPGNLDPRSDPWTSHTVGVSSAYVKDVHVADLDQDGLVDIVTRRHDVTSVFRQSPADTWSRKQISHPSKEGMDAGDLDEDGDLDILLNGFWLETPDDLINGSWSQRSIDSKWYTQNTGSWTDNCANAVVGDIDADGHLDVLFCHSEKTGWEISWYSATDLATDQWQEHVVTTSFNYCETLAIGDMDLDGDVDVIAGEMPKSSSYGDVVVFLNDGTALNWSPFTVAENEGIYNGIVADIGNDGDLDIVGCHTYNQAPIEWWENFTSPVLDRWHYIQVDNSRQKSSNRWPFGLAAGDVNGDGYGDIASGKYVYHNPGGDMDATWTRITLPTTPRGEVDACLIVDVDGDAYGDLIAQMLDGVYWFEATDAGATSWSYKEIGTVTATSHGNSQGYALADIVAGGRPEIVLSGGSNPSSMYYFEIPAQPDVDPWPKTRITNQGTEEGIGVADIDGDGHVDIASSTTVSSGNLQIAWWKNPGDGTADWNRTILGDTEGNYPDRCAVADINNDDRPDVIVTEETSLEPARCYWFEQPQDPLQGSWTRHLVVNQYTMNSMDVADMDGDGDTDIVVGEHRGDERVQIWENRNAGQEWIEHRIDAGKESHLGARLFDLDQDGDLEVVSIAFDDYPDLHLWRNDADASGLALTVATPVISPAGGTFGDQVQVEMSVDTDGAVIRMTQDGSIPTESSPLYSGPFLMTTSQTIRARAFKTDYNASPVRSAVFTIDTDAPTLANAQAMNNTQVRVVFSEPVDASGAENAAHYQIDNGIAVSAATLQADATTVLLSVDPLSEQILYTLTVDQVEDLYGHAIAPQSQVSFTYTAFSRIQDDLVALYTFEEGSGSTVYDVSGVGTALNLTIETPANTAWKEGALEVQTATRIASSSAASKISTACQASDELTIEAWVKPANTTQTGPARIVTYSQDAYERNFTLGQGVYNDATDQYDIRLRTTTTSTGGTPSVSTGGGTLTTDLTHVVYTRASDGSVSIYLNGTEVISTTVGGDFSTWNNSYLFALANELQDDRPWLGEFHLVAVYSAALSETEVQQNYQAGANPPFVQAKIRLYLQGFFDGTDMADGLSIPTQPPYSEDPNRLQHTVNPIPADITDWVLVQLKGSADGPVVSTVSALLRKDGYLVSDDGSEEIVRFDNLSDGDYYIQISHRNHLAVISSQAWTLSDQTVTFCDLTQENAIAGDDRSVQLSTGARALVSGDIDQDGQVNSADYVLWYNDKQNGAGGYMDTDLNGDGIVDISDFQVWQGNARVGY